MKMRIDLHRFGLYTCDTMTPVTGVFQRMLIFHKAMVDEVV